MLLARQAFVADRFLKDYETIAQGYGLTYDMLLERYGLERYGMDGMHCRVKWTRRQEFRVQGF